MTGDGFEPTRWWRVTYPGPDGVRRVWCESSDEDQVSDAYDRCDHPGASIQRLYERTEREWRDA